MIRLSIYKLNFKLEKPLQIAFYTFLYRESVIIKMEYKDYVGLGEASPFELITLDTQDNVIQEAKQLLTIPLDPTYNSIEDLHTFLDGKITSRTLRTALDFAYHDLLGKVKNVPVYKLYSKKTKKIVTSITLTIKNTPEETALATSSILRTYPNLQVLKVKLKGNKDVDRVKAIKKVTPKSLKFIIDGNQCYGNEQKAISSIKEIQAILRNVIIVEEPCPKAKLTELKKVKNAIQNAYVIADESVVDLTDAKLLIRRKAADGINIKLQKAGGIWKAKEIATLCNKNNLKIMVGCMLEGPIGIAAGIHFAISTPNILVADLDSDLFMKSHAKFGPFYSRGMRFIENRPGLGVDLDEKVLNSLKRHKEIVYEKI